jgi:hypothetical protein
VEALVDRRLQLNMVVPAAELVDTEQEVDYL